MLAAFAGPAARSVYSCAFKHFSDPAAILLLIRIARIRRSDQRQAVLMNGGLFIWSCFMGRSTRWVLLIGTQHAATHNAMSERIFRRERAAKQISAGIRDQSGTELCEQVASDDPEVPAPPTGAAPG